MANVIETNRFTKHYGRRTAVDALSITVPRGVIAGFIGPNGAGKTTTMGMLLGLVAPSAGGGSVLGQPLHAPRRYLHRVGATVEGPALYRGLSGAENLRLLAVAGGQDPAEVPAILQLVGLAGRANDRFGGYSMGMRQRLAIGAALLGDPELLILDEPTNGLDPAAIHEMRQLITTLAGHGRTVFVSSHQLSELEQICDWLVVIDQGRLIFQGPPTGFGGDGTRLVLEPERVEDIRRLNAILERAGYATEVEEGLVRVGGIPGDHRETAASINRLVAGEGITLVELHAERMNLEERYLAVLGGEQSETMEAVR